ncbi:MAG: ABC transporter ATP-binding protein [Candidatus Gastranaerophilales bacterium]|nr:ABC transporter ATP-binding protein [Candidatus Gastranaerophilales bacterium]
MKKLIEIKGLSKEFPIKKGFFNRQVGAVHAVNNINLDIYAGETLGLVGESGCGKSTTGRCILGLTDITKGTVKIDNIELSSADSKTIKNLRKRMQIIFQNPYSSLNPRMSILDSLREPFIIHKTLRGKALNQRLSELLEMVGLSTNILSRYPHEFSGGQRQRIVIARALALNPDFIVADEPVSSLDVSIQAQIINLLEDLKKQLGLTYLFISHDLSVVRFVSDRVAVMYLGEIIELAPANLLFDSPKHPYTQALLSAIPVPDPDASKKEKRILLEGDLPSPANPPSGCKFHTRCLHVMDICKNHPPIQTETEKDHFVNCYLYN